LRGAGVPSSLTKADVACVAVSWKGEVMSVMQRSWFGGGAGLLLAIATLLVLTAAPPAAHAGDAEKGRQVVETRSLGNCIACHYLPGLESPGDIGPNLVESMEAYGEGDRADVKQWVVDARAFNPDTIMPPFGANEILTPEQIDDVVAFLYSLKKK
jgi:sulfur-oxidizing protein SoxX